MKLLRSALTLALLIVPVATALATQRVDVVPVPPGTPIQKMTIGSPNVDECGLVYDNTSNFTGYFYDAGAGTQAADDLHMISGGNLCRFDFAYYKGSMGTTDATVTIYANDPSDNPPVVVVAGPYVLAALPGAGAYMAGVAVTPVAVPPDVWIGVSFSTAGTGLLTMDPPTIGTSDDFFFVTPPGEYAFFGGNPAANFAFAVHAAIATPTRPSTWGSVKQLYR